MTQGHDALTGELKKKKSVQKKATTGHFEQSAAQLRVSQASHAQKACQRLPWTQLCEQLLIHAHRSACICTCAQACILRYDQGPCSVWRRTAHLVTRHHIAEHIVIGAEHGCWQVKKLLSVVAQCQVALYQGFCLGTLRTLCLSHNAIARCNSLRAVGKFLK